MAEEPRRKISIRRIPNAPIQQPNAMGNLSPSKRTVTFKPPGGGTFTPNDLSLIVLPPNARGFKVIRVMGGRYNRPDNPQGLGTEGPFGIESWPDEDSDFSVFEDLEITKVIFDVAP